LLLPHTHELGWLLNTDVRTGEPAAAELKIVPLASNLALVQYSTASHTISIGVLCQETIDIAEPMQTPSSLCNTFLPHSAADYLTNKCFGDTPCLFFNDLPLTSQLPQPSPASTVLVDACLLFC
jgi:hypothetical protein